VTIFFDTSVLVAACQQAHEHYAQAWPALRRVVSGRDKGFMGAHSIAEMYATLTRLPVRPRIHPVEAARIVTENILPHFETVPISKKDYLQALDLVMSGGWPGAKIYDALLLCCAEKCGAQLIYTFNLRDFQQLAPANLQDRICAPPVGVN
jgi:predicted nucleic acid-binding protein